MNKREGSNELNLDEWKLAERKADDEIVNVDPAQGSQRVDESFCAAFKGGNIRKSISSFFFFLVYSSFLLRVINLRKISFNFPLFSSPCSYCCCFFLLFPRRYNVAFVRTSTGRAG